MLGFLLTKQYYSSSLGLPMVHRIVWTPSRCIRVFVVDYWLVRKLARPPAFQRFRVWILLCPRCRKNILIPWPQCNRYGVPGYNSLWSLTIQVQMLVLPSTTFMTLDKLNNLSVLQCFLSLNCGWYYYHLQRDISRIKNSKHTCMHASIVNLFYDGLKMSSILWPCSHWEAQNDLCPFTLNVGKFTSTLINRIQQKRLDHKSLCDTLLAETLLLGALSLCAGHPSVKKPRHIE